MSLSGLFEEHKCSFFKLEIAHLIPASHRKWNASEKWILGDPVPEAVKAFLAGGPICR